VHFTRNQNKQNVSLRSGVGDFYKVVQAYIYKKLTGKVFTN